jgi:hypothetical protein
MLAFARVNLLLTEEEFFSLSLRMFAQMMELWAMRRREERRRFAQLRADIVNFSMRHPERFLHAEDVDPSIAIADGKVKEPRKRINRNLVAEQIRMVAQQFMRSSR